ncbi:MAG: lysophospholipase L1-like esterase [Candidatus Binatia bacterium]
MTGPLFARNTEIAETQAMPPRRSATDRDSRAAPASGATATSWTKRLAGLVAALVLALIAAEGVLRIVAPIPYHEWIVYNADPAVGYLPEPGQLIVNRHGGHVQINKHGFRGGEWALDATPETLRIAVFGGSAAFCFEAASDQAPWPNVLEHELTTQLGQPVEVLNFGIPGFTTDRSLRNYKAHGRDFAPDLVLVYHTWNDLKLFRHRDPQDRTMGPYVPTLPTWQKIVRSLQLGRYARNAVWAADNRRLEGRFAAAEPDAPTAAVMPIDGAQFEREREDFTAFVHAVQADGGRVALVSQAGLASPENVNPQFVSKHLGDLARMTDFLGMSVDQVVRSWVRVGNIIEEVARTEGALFIDGWNAVPHEPEFFNDHVHLSDKGSHRLAKAIAKELGKESGTGTYFGQSPK